MKIIIATDIHGSYTYAKKVVDAFLAERADYMVLLGDFYYHGARNDLPDGYSTAQVFGLLNEYADKIIAVRGNCDSQVDETVSKFPFNDSAFMVLGGKRLFFTHGHRFNAENPPPLGSADFMFYGHFHINRITKIDGLTAVNIASASLPKQGAPHSYAVADENGFTIRDLNSGEAVTKFPFA